MIPKITTLPMFPLNMIVLPGEQKVLHVFESRYKELVVDCLQNQANFGIPFMRNGEITQYGVEVKILKIAKTYDNGEVDIIVEGIEAFKILKYMAVLSPKLYGAAHIEGYEEDMISCRYKMFRSLKKYIKSAKGKEIPVEMLTNVSVYKVASLLELTNDEKHELISFTELKEKEDYLIAKLKLFMHIYKLETGLNGQFYLN